MVRRFFIMAQTVLAA